MNAATKQTATVHNLIARASDNWGAAGITVRAEYVYRSAVEATIKPRRGVLTTITIADADCSGEGYVVIQHNELTNALTICAGEGKCAPVSVDRAAALVEARINVWIARRELSQALRAAEEAAFLAIHCDEGIAA